MDVAHKDRAAQIWCENAMLLTGVDWRYLKAPEREFKKLQPTEFGDLGVFASPLLRVAAGPVIDCPTSRKELPQCERTSLAE